MSTATTEDVSRPAASRPRVHHTSTFLAPAPSLALAPYGALQASAAASKVVALAGEALMPVFPLVVAIFAERRSARPTRSAEEPEGVAPKNEDKSPSQLSRNLDPMKRFGGDKGQEARQVPFENSHHSTARATSYKITHFPQQRYARTVAGDYVAVIVLLVICTGGARHLWRRRRECEGLRYASDT